ncbi:DUF3093 domain-containing protein [Actinokineospora sp. HUAS TT18]|uniref:DUF3093 domain-containing protein n=1 Tax=Actinokineospora sp. HUAS TT18 TaxID=3447451 RepID=UPI003F52777B
MTDSSGTAHSTTTAQQFAERLYVTWYWWPLPLVAAGLLAAEIHMGYPGVRSWLPYVVLLPLTLLLIVRSGRTRVAVEDGELKVGDAHVPLEFVGKVETFGANEKRKVLGPHLDPAAFMLHRGWVGPLVRVELTDPADPTPYWVFSTRRPAELAAVLRDPRT